MSSDKSVQNGYEADSLDEIPPVMEIQPAIRARLFEMILAIGACLFFVYLLKQIPLRGYYLDSLIGIKMNLLHIKINYEVLAWPCRIGALLSFGYGVWVVLQQKMTVYQLNDRNIIFTRGVINRTSDSTDLVAVRDHKLSRSLNDRILGLSKLVILSKDITDPEMPIHGIRAEDAQKMINFLRKYAFQNYTEWRLSKEREKMRQNNSRKKVDDSLGFSDDGDAE